MVHGAPLYQVWIYLACLVYQPKVLPTLQKTGDNGRKYSILIETCSGHWNINAIETGKYIIKSSVKY